MKRLWVLIAVKLIIIAILITVVRFAISNVDNYKQLFFEWVAEEHGLHVDAEKISAGIDFSGLIITLNKVTFIDSKVLPFELKIDDLFLHFDFVESIKKQRVVFNDISIKGADLLVKSIPEDPDAIPYGSLGPEPQTQSDITLDALKNIFLLRVNSFVISDSSLRFTDHLHNQKKILIDELSWANNGKNHQGVGKATLPGFTKGDNNLTFIINLTGDAESSNDQLIGTLFINAENVDLSEYLTPQINPLADLKKSLVSFKLWGTFDFNGPKALQLSWGNSEIAWSLLDQTHHWQLNDGYMQFSYQKTKWLFDSYDLNLTHNLIPSNDINISGSGLVGRAGEFDLSGVNVNDIVPFGLLFSGLDETEIQRMNAFELGGQVTKLGLHFDQDEALNISIKMDYLNSQSVDDFPAINDATVLMSANQKGGHGRIQIGAQDINFNGQFNRVIPLKSADINLSWKNDQQGFEISSEESVIKTDDVDSTTQFSILFPAQETDISEPVSPLLTLYSIVSLNDGSKANHYYPIKIMGKEIYDYLQPTLKKGNIKDAKILWSGHFSDFPFQNNEGVFQAFVPITNAKYDFYPGWKGISDLDLVINFENDSLGMVSSKGKLGNVQLS